MGGTASKVPRTCVPKVGAVISNEQRSYKTRYVITEPRVVLQNQANPADVVLFPLPNYCSMLERGEYTVEFKEGGGRTKKRKQTKRSNKRHTKKNKKAV